MARDAVARRGVSIRLACEAFGVSQMCYRYERQRNAENEQIADWLLRLTDNHRNWGFGWNHKRVYRIYRERELDLRIKPRRRLVRQAPDPLICAGVGERGMVDGLHARPS
ncbi:HTH-like domain-containing protein [Cupriavidus sp. H19C3]